MRDRIVGYLISVGGVLAVTLILSPFYPAVRGITAATALLIVVLLVAMTRGTGPALVSSLLGVLYLNFYYVPPVGKLQFQLAQGEDLVALIAFLVTSILVGQLSSRAQRRAQTIQELNDELIASFDRASQLEAVKRSERLKSALLDSVTHDLRTPLTSIKAAATALMDVQRSKSGSSGDLDHGGDEAGGSETRPYERLGSGKNDAADSENGSIENLAGNIIQQSDRLNRFIEGMIELAQVESGREQGEQRAEVIAIEEIFGVALARAEDMLRYNEVIVECQDHLYVAISPKAIAQVLFSLLENACHYSFPDTTIRMTARRAGSENVQVAVEDEGPGVPEHLREKVFDKFFRSSVSERRDTRAAGLGLGLAIARGIVEAHGGKIWVEDRGAGKSGARFVFSVPANNIELSCAEGTVPQ